VATFKFYPEAELGLEGVSLYIAKTWCAQPWLSNGGWLFVFERNKLASPNEIKLKRYTAKCSICGGVVRIHKGGLAYPGRLVGRCDNSPREYVFSFDHHQRSGKHFF